MEYSVSIEDCVVIEGVTKEISSEDGVSILGRKRKHLDEVDEVSTSLKKAHIIRTSGAVNHNQTYHISKSSRRLKQQLDDVVSKLSKLQRGYKVSKQKTRRLKRKL